MLLGSLVLGPRQLPWFVVFMLLLVVVLLTSASDEIDVPRPCWRLLVHLRRGLHHPGDVVPAHPPRRRRPAGESMLVDLRDRIQSQGGDPELPDDWHARVGAALGRAARRSPATSSSPPTARRRPARGRRRRRLRQGRARPAPGRCCSPVPSAACSARCRRTSSCPPPTTTCSARTGSEGFATAVHLSLDLRTGDFELRTAGHPPAVQRAAGSGRWRVHPSRGTGARADRRTPSSRACAARCAPATRCCSTPTGWSRRRSRDIGLGIDRMLGQAERLLRGGFEGGASG